MTSSTARVFHPSFKESFNSSGIFARLGLVTIHKDDLVSEIRHGLSVTVIDKMVKELGVSQRTLLKVIALPTATLTRRRTQKYLSPQESDRVYRLAAVYRAALQLFESDSEAARHWINEPAKALGGHSPLQHSDTEAGADEVQDLIGRLEHGVIT